MVQFCGNSPTTVLSAAQYVENHCDAVDLNLGCPQGIARRGHYGSFLMEDWALIHRIIHTLAVELRVPVTAKIRVYPDVEKTVAYARMVVEAGAWMLAVHGRTREMKGAQTSLADWEQIRAIREALPYVPVLANGNILTGDDVEHCLRATGCAGILSAEGLLYDPRLFLKPTGQILYNGRYKKLLPLDVCLIDTVEDVVRRYLEYSQRYGAVASHVKAHLFKLLFHLFAHYPELRVKLGDSCGNSIDTLPNCAANIIAQARSNFLLQSSNILS